MKSRAGKTTPPQKSPDSGSLGNAIRELRRRLGQTQVQFASELKITPTSVYRYEAGSSLPESDILIRILQYAVDKQLPHSVQELSEEIAKRTGFNPLEGERLSSETPFIRALGTLRLEKRMLAMALVSMLLKSEDATESRILEALLGPWIPKAKEMFGGPDLAFQPPANPRESLSAARKTQVKK